MALGPAVVAVSANESVNTSTEKGGVQSERDVKEMVHEKSNLGAKN